MSEKKNGRPHKVIDQKEFEKLCGLQCTKLEICDFLDVADKTLESWCKRTYGQGFYEVFRQKRGKGKIALRRYQFELARSNATMAIWLGKNWLNQSEAPEEEAEETATEINIIVDDASKGESDE